MTRRFVQLMAGLALFGTSIGLMVRAEIGLPSWDVLHLGLAKTLGWSMGSVVIAVSVLVLALWWPLRQVPGIGTVLNVVLVGLSLDATLALLPPMDELGPQIAFLFGGIVVNGIATGLYIGAGLGAGPRDGLMTGLAARGLSIRLARTVIEVAVVALGWLLGGSVGIGTIAYALLIGHLAQFFIPFFATDSHQPKEVVAS